MSAVGLDIAITELVKRKVLQWGQQDQAAVKPQLQPKELSGRKQNEREEERHNSAASGLRMLSDANVGSAPAWSPACSAHCMPFASIQFLDGRHHSFRH